MVTVNGAVTEMVYTNPHVQVYWEVKNEKGVSEKWQGELTAPNKLNRAGWNKNTLKPGDKITITGRKVKSGAPYMNLTERANVVLTDSNKEIFRTPNFGEPPPPDSPKGTNN